MKTEKTLKSRPNVATTRRTTPVSAACQLTLAVFAAGAQAQTAPAPASNAQSLETVVITGIRRSLETAVSLKRETHGLVDGIVAEDIGKFPDTNLAESMQRISGVSIDRGASGEGSQVTVRGVGPSFNQVLLNGRQMPTAVIGRDNAGANSSRAFDFANLSSDSVSALEVYKTARSSQPTGGIGATINIKTARPLDVKQQVASLGIKANFDGSNSRLPGDFKGDSLTPEFSGIYSSTFADNTIGISISGNYSKRDSGSNRGYTQNGWRTFTASSGDWGAIPPKPATGTDPITNRPTSGVYSTSVDMRYQITAIERERLNGQATLQFAPSKDLKFTLDYTMADNTIKQRNAEMSSWFNFSFGPTSFTSGSPASPLTQTALFPNNDHDLSMNSGTYGQKSQNRSTGFNTEWKVSSELSVDLDAHHSTANTKPNSPYGTYTALNLGMFSQGTATAYYDQKLPILNLGNTVFDTARTMATGSQFVSNLSDQSIDQWQAKATYKLSADDKLMAGLGFTKVKNRAASRNNQHDDWGGIGAQGDFKNVAFRNEAMTKLFSQIPGNGDSRLIPNFTYVNFEQLREQAIAVVMAKGVGGSAPLSRAQAEAYFAASPDYSAGNDWRTNEKSTSAFVQYDHSFDTAIPMNIAVGLRRESTKVDSSSQVVARTGTSWGSQNEVNLLVGAPTFGSASGKYSYVLPSIDWDADLSSDIKVRASYGENIGRPGWGSLTGGVSLDANANAGGGTGSTGNPALKPLLSKNLDASVEWYYAKSSYVALGLFHKKVSNFIDQTNVTQTVPGLTTPIGGAYYKAGQAACGGATAQPLCIRNYIFNNFKGQPGVTQTGVNASGEILGTIAGLPTDPLVNFLISTPSNAAGDKIKGMEFSVQHSFGNSGFGVSANYTLVRTGLKFDNEATTRQSALVGVSDSANLVGFYEDSAWSVRAAYNWRDKFLAAASDGGGNNPVYTEAYGQVDLSIGYKWGKNLTLQADLINLTDGYIRQHSRTEAALQSVTQTGRRYLIGARYKF